MRAWLIVSVVALSALLPWTRGAGAADTPSNASCAAIAFRPVGAGAADGEQTAGYYKMRLGRIEVMADVRGGEARRYYVALNGNPPPAIREQLPPAIVACAKAKRLSPPESPDANCVGDRLVVLIAHTSERRYLLLYTHSSGAWRFCSAGLY